MSIGLWIFFGCIAWLASYTIARWMRNRARYKEAVRRQGSIEITVTPGHPFIKGSVVAFKNDGTPYEVIEENPDRGTIRIKKKEDLSET